MRYYLDANILVYLLSQNKDEVHFSVKNILSDPSNILFVSSISLSELVLLYRTGKFKIKSYKTEQDILDNLEQFNIQMIFFNEFHFKRYLTLSINEKHKDVIDHMIIAQAISDKIPLISSDHEFKKC
jgi:PIN domain nuclease of toxin-antitoxin system